MPNQTDDAEALQTVSLVLKRSQADRLRAITAGRRTPENRLSISTVAREVFERGLEVVCHGHDSHSPASRERVEGAA